MLALCSKGALEQRHPLGINELGPCQIPVSVMAVARVPFALDMVTPDLVPVRITRSASLLILDPEIIKPARTCFKADTPDDSVSSKHVRSEVPELAGLERISVPAWNDRERHAVDPASSRNDGVGVMVRASSKAREGVTFIDG